MENLGQNQNIIVRRIKKGKHGHHGGAWKVAMADFALAMMALFLVLWIINSSNEQQRAAISGYFQDPKAYDEGTKMPSRYIINMGGTPPHQADNTSESATPDPEKILNADDIESMAEAIERRRMEQNMQAIQASINASPTLSPFKNQLLLDITTEGLRLQIVDQTNRPMFNSGSSNLNYYSEDILWELAPLLASMSNRLSISGHTDSSRTANVRDEDDANWRLSAMRADAARVALMEAGVPKSQVAQIIGMADTAPLSIDDPYSTVNRRISITLLNKKAAADVRGRGVNDDGSDIDFINDDKGTTEDERREIMQKADGVLKDLREKRESEDNSYDTPPNRNEVFW